MVAGAQARANAPAVTVEVVGDKVPAFPPLAGEQSGVAALIVAEPHLPAARRRLERLQVTVQHRKPDRKLLAEDVFNALNPVRKKFKIKSRNFSNESL